MSEGPLYPLGGLWPIRSYRTYSLLSRTLAAAMRARLNRIWMLSFNLCTRVEGVLFSSLAPSLPGTPSPSGTVYGSQMNKSNTPLPPHSFTSALILYSKVASTIP